MAKYCETLEQRYPTGADGRILDDLEREFDRVRVTLERELPSRDTRAVARGPA